MAPLLEYESVEISLAAGRWSAMCASPLAPGRSWGSWAESGSGKSSLLRAALGLLGPGGAVSGGRIRFRGQDLTALSRAGAAEDPGRADRHDLSGRRRVAVPHPHHRCTDLREPGGPREDLPPGRRGKRPWPCLKSCAFPTERASGQLSLCAVRRPVPARGIAAAMLPSPAVLLCDEPTSALDVLVQKQVVEELLRLRELFGTAMIW